MMKLFRINNNPAHLIVFLLLLACILPSSMAVNAQEDEDDFFIFDEDIDDSPSVADPLESFNRITFSLNDKLYRGVLKPIARGLRVFPLPIRNSGANIFNNLGTPVSAMNALLQLDLPNTGTEISRFLVNSTVGLLGIFDPATNMGLIRENEDLGQTFGRYGIGHGVYLVIPFFGPSSLRDIVGSVYNTDMNPVFQNLATGEIIAYNLVEAEIALSIDQDTYEAFYDGALDPYIFFRSAYIQNRAGQVEQ